MVLLECMSSGGLPMKRVLVNLDKIVALEPTEKYKRTYVVTEKAVYVHDATVEETIEKINNHIKGTMIIN